jgi:hypothetical protein
MFIERAPHRNSPPCILVRETCCHAGDVKRRTIAHPSTLASSRTPGAQTRASAQECAVEEDGGQNPLYAAMDNVG